MRLGFGVLFTVLLISACITDVQSRRIPNPLVGALAVGGLAYAAFVSASWVAVGWAILGLALGFGIWIVFYAIGVLGAGDVKLAAAAGAWLGVSGIWRASLLAGAIGGLLAIAMLARERRMRESVGRIGVALSTGSLATLRPRLGDATAENPTRGRPMPYGVALAAGALIAAWFPGVLG